MKTPGATYFFTVVTYERQRVFSQTTPRRILRNAIKEVNGLLPFIIEAWVLLPDHVHCMWALPQGDYDYSKRWGLIKSKFTKKMKNVGWALPTKIPISASRIKQRESNIWQRRFWEHQIRDQEDYNRHCDYIHYNPVKHDLVDDPKKWKHSTLHRFIKNGMYPDNWGDSISDEVLRMDVE